MTDPKPCCLLYPHTEERKPMNEITTKAQAEEALRTRPKAIYADRGRGELLTPDPLRVSGVNRQTAWLQGFIAGCEAQEARIREALNWLDGPDADAIARAIMGAREALSEQTR